MESKNGVKHHSGRTSAKERCRRLSKQEEVDVDDVALVTNHVNNRPSVTIHVEDQCDTKAMIKNDSMEEPNECSERELSPSDDSYDIHKGQSQSFGSNLNVNCNNLAAGDIKDKRGKQLTRGDAVRDISPPPDYGARSETNSEVTANENAGITDQSQSDDSSDNKQHKLKQQINSQGSAESNSPCISRDSSTENYTDSTGIDLEEFLIGTLKTNKNGRMLLLKIEQDLTQLVKDSGRTTFKFQPMSSYNRMLVHRVAAFYGFDHNTDYSDQGVGIMINKTKNTRIPELKFRDYIKDDIFLHEPKKLILKRDSASLDDTGNQSDAADRSPDRQSCLNVDNRSKSFEEREERYEKARARIFNQDSSSSTEGPENTIHVILDSTECNNTSEGSLLKNNNESDHNNSQDDIRTNWTNDGTQRPWSSTDSDSSGRPQKQSNQTKPFRSGNSLDSDITPKSTTASSSTSASSSGMIHLTPDVSFTENLNPHQLNNNIKPRPNVARAESFGGISKKRGDNSICNNGSTQHQLTKSRSINVTPSSGMLNNSGKCSPSVTPKTVVGAQHNDNVVNSVIHNSVHHHNPLPPQVLTNTVTSPSHSQLNQQPWMQNLQMRHELPNAVNWPTIGVNNYGASMLLANATESHMNQPKEMSFPQPNQLLMHGFPQQMINSDSIPAHHDTQQQSNVLFFSYQMPNNSHLSFNPHTMQIQENSAQRLSADALVPQIGAVSLNSSSPPIQQQFPYLRHNNSLHSNIGQNQYQCANPQRMPIQSQPHISQQLLQQQQQQQQQQIRLLYTNPTNVQHQHVPQIGTYQSGHHQIGALQNHLNHVPFQIQQQNQIGQFPSNHTPPIHSNTNNTMIPTNMSQVYGTQIQVPQQLHMYLLSNNAQSNAMTSNTAPLIPAQTSSASVPQSHSLNSNISPYVGMSYQHYHPTIPTSTQSGTLNASQNAVLKAQSLLTNQSKTHHQRFNAPNGNHFTPQVPDFMDVNILGANSFPNRTPQPQQQCSVNNVYRRLPLMQNQALDVRLLGSAPSTPFLLPTPQRPFMQFANPNPLMHYQIQQQQQRAKGASKRRPSQQHRVSASSSASSAYHGTNKNTVVPSSISNGPVDKSNNRSHETHSSAKSANDGVQIDSNNGK